ncbi:MAG: hypothetical protein P9L99_15825 [Candidatus Lernaella stagnicola]|nr:hypothetical protein [Candidatus Lernaella stagnicola]
MEQQDWIGIGILASAIIFLAILLRFRAIRQNPFMLIVFSINPGLVGVLAACAFLFRNYNNISQPCWYTSLVLAVTSTFIVAFALPRMFLQHVREQIEDTDGQDPDQGESQNSNTP